MSLASLKTGIISAVLGFGAAFGAASSPGKPDSSMLVSTEWLAKNLSDPSVVVIVVDRNDSAYKAGHVPGARYLPYATLGQTVDGIQLELPSPDSIKNLFESLGVSNTSHVVLTGRPLTVTRAFYTLDYIGMQHISALDGGFTKWKREGRASETLPPSFSRGHIAPAPRP
jgi:thiosulfate/3-mercaptopyruvate sulfurtransferase